MTVLRPAHDIRIKAIGLHWRAESLTFLEDNATLCTARWFALSDPDTGGPTLFPKGLKPLLLQ